MDPSVLGISWRKQLWHKWKALRRVPFRKSWFVGYDLEGNSYWELIDRNNPSRLRRKVSLDRPYFHFSDFKPHPMWMQWLQFTRRTPPTLVDLTEDAKRQYRLKLLAKEADAKWKAVPLKSQSSGKNDDPRLTSSWSGGGTTEPASKHAYNYESSSAKENARHIQSVDSDNRVFEAMEHAEVRRSKAPKLIRDELGQVRTAEDKKSEK